MLTLLYVSQMLSAIFFVVLKGRCEIKNLYEFQIIYFSTIDPSDNFNVKICKEESLNI